MNRTIGEGCKSWIDLRPCMIDRRGPSWRPWEHERKGRSVVTVPHTIPLINAKQCHLKPKGCSLMNESKQDQKDPPLTGRISMVINQLYYLFRAKCQLVRPRVKAIADPASSRALDDSVQRTWTCDRNGVFFFLPAKRKRALVFAVSADLLPPQVLLISFNSI